ncbi:MAG: PIN domain nuclease [Micropruina sp.]|uniref:type II toxin-antitoxin system VapC family toxin n=1 Tax=Micropruina sp. TaxID=2737536 RepID=UPI0039E280FF
MSGLLVDTSVWSLAYRRDVPPGAPEVEALRSALLGGEEVAVTGMILLELLRGFVPDAARQRIVADLAHVQLLEPTRDDYAAAADLATTCRRSGVQIGSVDALIAQLAIAHDCTLLSTDADFAHAARVIPLRLWFREPPVATVHQAGAP